MNGWLKERFQSPQQRYDALKVRGQKWADDNTHVMFADDAEPQIDVLRCAEDVRKPVNEVTAIYVADDKDPEKSLRLYVTRMNIASEDACLHFPAEVLRETPLDRGGRVDIVKLAPFWGDVDRLKFDKLSAQLEDQYDQAAFVGDPAPKKKLGFIDRLIENSLPNSGYFID